jgi:hypothetical protein
VRRRRRRQHLRLSARPLSAERQHEPLAIVESYPKEGTTFTVDVPIGARGADES